MGWVRTRRPIVPPAFMAQLVGDVSKAPVEELRNELADFERRCDFERDEERSLYNWIDVINRFDHVLEAYCANDPLIQAVGSAELQKSDDPPAFAVSKDLLCAVLRATLLLVDHAYDETKNVYNSTEHLIALLVDDDPNVVVLVLEIFSALLFRSHKPRPTRAHAHLELADRLLTMTKGWGTKDNGLGTADCCSTNVEELSSEGGLVKLTFEVNGDSETDPAEQESQQSDADAGRPKATQPVEKGVIRISDAAELDQPDLVLLNHCAARSQLPRKLYFVFLSAVRLAKAFWGGVEARRQRVNMRVLALSALTRMHFPPDHFGRVFRREGELLPDLMSIVNAEASEGLRDVSCTLRVNVLKCLASVALGRKRFAQVSSSAGVSSHHGALPSLLRSEISIITAAQAGDDVDMVNGDASQAMTNHLRLTENIIALLRTLAIPMPSSSGASSLVGAGIVGILVPLVSDQKAAHLGIVREAVKCLQAIIENTNSNSGAAAFRDHDGLEVLAQRIADDVLDEESGAELAMDVQDDDAIEKEALAARNETRELYAALAAEPKGDAAIALQPTPPSSSAAARGSLEHSRYVLLKELFVLMTTAHHSVGGGTRELIAGPLPAALRRIVARPFTYGGSLFSCAATVLVDVAHSEPTSMSLLADAGIPSAFLKSVALGLPPSGDAIRCVPNLIAAICLSSAGLNCVKKSAAIVPYLARLGTPFYSRAMQAGETPMRIGQGMDELMRHVPALRTEGNSGLSLFLNHAAKFTSSAVQSCDTSAGATQEGSGTQDAAAVEKARLAIAYGASRLCGFGGASAEHQSVVVNTGGLVDLLALRHAPAMACVNAGGAGSSSNKSSISSATCLTAIVNALRSLGTRYASAVLRQLFEVVRTDSAKVMQISEALGQYWLEEEDHLRSANDTSNSTSPNDSRAQTRAELSAALSLLAVDTVILTGLTRGSGFSIGTWDTASVGQIGMTIACVERHARWHLARAFSGVRVGTANEEFDLAGAVVSVSAPIALVPVEDDIAVREAKVVSSLLGVGTDEQKLLLEDARKTKVPAPETHRVSIGGLVAALAKFVLTVEQLYVTLSKSMTSAVRRGRDSVASNIRALAETMGRLFALHFAAAQTLWDCRIRSCGNGQIVAAWEFLRGVCTSFRMTVLDEGRQTIEILVLDAFFRAGGGRLLETAFHPNSVITVASSPSSVSSVTSDGPGAEEMESSTFVEVLLKYYSRHDDTMSDAGATQEPRRDGREGVPSVEKLREMQTYWSRNNATTMTRRMENTVRIAAVYFLGSVCYLAKDFALCQTTSGSMICRAEWEADDINRTKRRVVCSILGQLMQDPQDAFNAAHVREFMVNGVLPVAQEVASWCGDSIKLEEESSKSTPEDEAEAELVADLGGMGFDRSRVLEGIRQKGSGSRLAVLEWLLSNPAARGSENQPTDNVQSKTANGRLVSGPQIVRVLVEKERDELELSLAGRMSKETMPKVLETNRKMYFQNDETEVAGAKVNPCSVEELSTVQSEFLGTLNSLAQAALEGSLRVCVNELPFMTVKVLRALESGPGIGVQKRLQHSRTMVRGLSSLVHDLFKGPKKKREEIDRMMAVAQTTVVWGHFGGPVARRALRDANAMEECYKVLVHLKENPELLAKQGSGEKRPVDDDTVARAVAICALLLESLVSHAGEDEQHKAPNDGMKDVPAEEIQPMSVAESEERGKNTNNDDLLATGHSNVDIAKEAGLAAFREAVQRALSKAEESTRPKGLTKFVHGLDIVQIANLAVNLVDLLGAQGNVDAVCACLQLLSAATQQFEIAKEVLTRDRLVKLLQLPCLGKEQPNGCRRLLRTIVRHLVEDEETLVEAMQYELRGLRAAKSSRISPQSVDVFATVTSPLWQRDPKAFCRAVAESCRLSGGVMIALEPPSQVSEDGLDRMETADVEARPNLVCVVEALFASVVKSATGGGSSGTGEQISSTSSGAAVSSLKLLSELAELSPTVASIILKTRSPSSSAGSAIDYVLQELLPRELANKATQGKLFESGKALVRSLCARNDSLHRDGVAVLRHALRSELDRDTCRPEAVRSVLSCLSPALPVVVLSTMTETGFDVLLIEALNRIEVCNSFGQDLANSILKKLEGMGQVTATGTSSSPVREEGGEEVEDIGAAIAAYEDFIAYTNESGLRLF